MCIALLWELSNCLERNSAKFSFFDATLVASNVGGWKCLKSLSLVTSCLGYAVSC
jgi:hypothetical protein